MMRTCSCCQLRIFDFGSIWATGHSWGALSPCWAAHQQQILSRSELYEVLNIQRRPDFPDMYIRLRRYRVCLCALGVSCSYGQALVGARRYIYEITSVPACLAEFLVTPTHKHCPRSVGANDKNGLPSSSPGRTAAPRSLACHGVATQQPDKGLHSTILPACLLCSCKRSSSSQRQLVLACHNLM